MSSGPRSRCILREEQSVLANDLGLIGFVRSRNAEAAKEGDNFMVDDGDSGLLRQLFQPIWVNSFGAAQLGILIQRKQLLRAGLRICVGELLRPCLQELQAPLVSSCDLQRLRRDGDDLTHVEVGELEGQTCIRILDAPLVRELSTHVPTVADGDLEDRNISIRRVVGDHQASELVLGLAVDHLALEAQHFAGELHHTLQVNLGRRGLDHAAVQQGVFLLAHSRVRRRHELRVRQRLLRYIDPSLSLVDTQILFVEAPCEVITVPEDHLAAPGVYRLTHLQILGEVTRCLTGEHPWCSIDEVALAKRSTFHEDWPLCFAGVAAMSLVDFDGVVSEIVVDDEVDSGSVGRVIVPVALEAQYFPVIQQELRQLLVDRRDSPHGTLDCLVFYGGSGQRNTASVERFREAVALLPQVGGNIFVLPKFDAVLLEKPAGKAIAATDVIGTAMQR
mmetsp:Transcript_22579/g.53244  ORF Transcript_22579/g.53244 Transcript_22579/m.53244 type:complete len:448 (-) Transcript_22579:599-1942(-)